MGLIVLVVSVWAVRRVTAPLGSCRRAAERLGRDVDAPPMAEAGTIEMRRAARAFNRMQERLRRLIENRTQMLAALSHDLRTPLTLLRLRAEEVAETEERDKMLATIGEMDAMIGVDVGVRPRRGARGTAPARRSRRAGRQRGGRHGGRRTAGDDDAGGAADLGMPARRPEARGHQSARQRGQVRQARAAPRSPPPAKPIEIDIDDEGPGIPEAELAKVFQPFYRLEESRSRETGGTGLGLAIAQSIVQAHGGELTLANRPGGGLRASINLPV